MFIINIFHINIRNFHNNDRPNKTPLTILGQLKIIKVNIIENFGKENGEKKKKKKKEIIFIVCFVYLNVRPIVALTLKVLTKVIDIFSK